MNREASRVLRQTTGVDWPAWRDLIAARSGLAITDAQQQKATELVRRRTKALGLSSEAGFYELLETEPDGGPEWHGLVERLVSHETAFFRHQPSFDALRQHMLPELASGCRSTSELTFWSAGCSTGQEAYSLAMVATSAAGLTGGFVVWGTDISRTVVEAARHGRYGPRAIADIPPEYRRFVRQVSCEPDEHEIVDEVKQHVRFSWADLQAASNGALMHDVIICQNVLIYFKPAAVARLVVGLASRLALGGFLLLGPGEAPEVRLAGVEPLNLSGVRAFRRVGYRPIEVRA